MNLAAQLYSLTARLPKEERYGLTAQIQRSAVSIPSNLAEDAARHSRKEYIPFLYVASGSIAELETQLSSPTRIGFVSNDRTLPRMEAVRKMLPGLLRSLKDNPVAQHSALSTTSS
jgi:four helix bundle protein